MAIQNPHPSTDTQVHEPRHYDVFPDVSAIEIIARTSTVAEFRGFCKGSVLKYHLRVGKKGTGTVYQDLAKADKYIVLYKELRHLCCDYIHSIDEKKS